MSLSGLRGLARMALSGCQLRAFPRTVPATARTRNVFTATSVTGTTRLLPSRQFSSSARTAASKYVRFELDPKRPWDTSKWDLGTRIAAAVATGGTLYYVYHLERVPETGRLRFMDINPAYETKLADAAYKELLHEFQGKILPSNHPITRHIHRVVTRILDANNLGVLKDSSASSRLGASTDRVLGPDEDFWNPGQGEGDGVAPGIGGREWTLTVVNDEKIVNAAATYGNILVFTGILPVCKDEPGLASVLGHEIGHVVARHSSERYSSAKVFIFLAYALDVLGIDFGFARILTTFLLDLPNSRTQELEADSIGLRLSATACYDPQAAPEMFARLGKVEQRLNVDFLYTHPTSEKRIKRLTEQLPKAYAIRAARPECSGIQEKLAAFTSSVAGIARGGGAGGDGRMAW